MKVNPTNLKLPIVFNFQEFCYVARTILSSAPNNVQTNSEVYCRSPNQSELTPIMSNMELTHLGKWSPSQSHIISALN